MPALTRGRRSFIRDDVRPAASARAASRVPRPHEGVASVWGVLATSGRGGAASAARSRTLASTVGRTAERPLEAEADRAARALATRAGGAPSTAETRTPAAAPSGGTRLPPALRERFEAGLGYELGHVRLHTSDEASRRARSLGARAYASGASIAFAPGEFDPRSDTGRRLIAHEVAHVVQQGGAPRRRGRAGGRDHRVARIADPPRPRADAPALQRQDEEAPELPGYSQVGDTCGAASIVSALMIRDRQRTDRDSPNETLVTACNIVLTYLAQHRTAVIRGWTENGQDGEALHRQFRAALRAIRDRARTPGTRISEDEYRTIGMALYYLYVDGRSGLSAADISRLHERIGLDTDRSTVAARRFDDIMSSPVIRRLEPGQIAQVGWYVRTSEPDPSGNVSLGLHAFLIGRFDDGRWFLSDQGPDPPTELVAPDLASLRAAIEEAARSGESWIFTGQPSTLIVGGWTGVRLLAGPEGVEAEAAGLVVPGTFLAEVDAGRTVTGERLHAGEFVSRHYSLAEAASVNTAGESGLIVEMPRGVFSYYRTDLLDDDDNVAVDGIDEPDSSGGLLTRRTFHHAWLRLCSDDVCRLKLLQVY